MADILLSVLIDEVILIAIKITVKQLVFFSFFVFLTDRLLVIEVQE